MNQKVRMARVYWCEAKCELLKKVRTPAFVVGTLLLPLMFYAFFGLARGHDQSIASVSVSTYVLATYGVFGVMGINLFGFGVSLAMERGQGWLQLKRASPMPPAAYFVAKLLVCVLLGLLEVVLLFAMGAVFGNVRMPFVDWLQFGAVLVSGAIPFGAMGLTIGYFASTDSAPAITNLTCLPMAFCSGLWMPLQLLPPGIQQFGKTLPAYHLAQIALAILKAPMQGSMQDHFVNLVAWTFIFTGLAFLGHHREEARVYG